MSEIFKKGDRVRPKALADWQNVKSEERTISHIWNAENSSQTFATLDDGSSIDIKNLLPVDEAFEMKSQIRDIRASLGGSDVLKIFSVYQKDCLKVGCFALITGLLYVKGEVVEISLSDFKQEFPLLVYHEMDDEEELCNWVRLQPPPEASDGFWVASCGDTHYDVFGPNGPVEKDYKCCPSCGRKLRVSMQGLI